MRNIAAILSCSAARGAAGGGPTIVGPNSPSTFANLGDGIEWGNLSGAASSDNNYATCNPGGFEASSTYRARNFGFSIPGGATITHIKVEIEVNQSGDGAFSDVKLAIHSAGDASDQIGNNLAPGDTITGLDTYFTSEGNQATWGTSLTAAQVNAATFSVDIKFFAFDGSEIFLDHIRVTITYTV